MADFSTEVQALKKDLLLFIQDRIHLFRMETGGVSPTDIRVVMTEVTSHGSKSPEYAPVLIEVEFRL